MLGVALILFKVLWQALSVWQTLDFLPGRVMPLADFLAGIWGTLILVGLGLLFLYRAVSARWPDSQANITSGAPTTGMAGEATAEANSPARPVRAGTSDDALRRRCRELADELRQFLEDNEKDLDEDDLVLLYNRRLGDKTSALLEELEEHGLYPAQKLKSYQLAANAKPLSPFAIRNLAGTLVTIGHKRYYEASGTPRIQRSAEELKKLCLHLAADLTEFDRRRRHADVSVEVRIKREKAATEEEANGLRQEEIEMERRHDAETVELYHQRYRPRIMDLYDELAPGGWLDDGDRELFEYVGDWTQPGEVAERLKTVGERLPDQ